MAFGTALYKFKELLEHRKYFRKCQRCFYHYDTRKGECSHCSHLDEAGLKSLFHERERNFQGRRQLGLMFAFAAVVAAIFLAISFVG